MILPSKKRIVGHILKKIIVIWFFKPAPYHFLKMSKFLAGHVTKMWFLKLWITSFWTQALHLNFKEDVVTIKRLTRYKQEVVLAAMLEGNSMPSNMAANTNHTALLKKSAIKYLP